MFKCDRWINQATTSEPLDQDQQLRNKITFHLVCSVYCMHDRTVNITTCLSWWHLLEDRTDFAVNTRKSLSHTLPVEQHFDYCLSSESLFIFAERSIKKPTCDTIISNMWSLCFKVCSCSLHGWLTISFDKRSHREATNVKYNFHATRAVDCVWYSIEYVRIKWMSMLFVSIIQLFTSLNVSFKFIACLHLFLFCFALLCYIHYCTIVKTLAGYFSDNKTVMCGIEA